MATSPTNLLVLLLRECLASHPQPWYLADYLKETNLAREPIEATLDQLRMAGLLALTPWVKDRGQGYTLTPHGRQVVEQPRLLARLESGKIPEAPAEVSTRPVERHALAGLRGEAVRDALLNDSRPIITQALIAANVAWFFVGLMVYCLRYHGSPAKYVAISPFGGNVGNLDLSKTYLDIGSLFIVKVFETNEWWRLVSYGFVHLGALHLGCNMLWLYNVGPLLERMWGRTVFLTIYLVTCAGSGALGLVLSPVGNMIGASGALCGLLGSMAAWVYLNRAYLPPGIVARWRQGIVMDVVMLSVVSMLPGVSWAGHAGGFVTGALIAWPLCMVRFGTGARRALGWAGMTAMVAAGLALMYGQVVKTMTGERWRPADVLEDRNGNHKEATPKNLGEFAKTLSPYEKLLHADEIALEIRNLALTEVFQAKTPDAVKGAKSTKKAENRNFAALQKRFDDRKNALDIYIAAIQTLDIGQKPALADAVKAGLACFRPTAVFAEKMAKVCAADGRMSIAERTDLQVEHTVLVNLRKEFMTAFEKINP